MTTRMTVQRLGRLIADGDVDAVRTAVQDTPGLLTRTVERDGQSGWTPLHLAVAEGQPDVVRVLVQAGADLTARTEFNRTPLHIALQLRPELVPLLRELGAEVDAPSAAYLGDVDQLTRHLDEGTLPGDRTSGADLLSWAAYGGAAATAELLLDRGADADTGALHFAAGGGRLALVRLLLEAGADVNRRDPATGRTPLHAAVGRTPTGHGGDRAHADRRRCRRPGHDQRRGQRPGHEPRGRRPAPARGRGAGHRQRRPRGAARRPRRHRVTLPGTCAIPPARTPAHQVTDWDGRRVDPRSSHAATAQPHRARRTPP